MIKLRNLTPGILLATFIASIAYFLGNLLPLIGGPIFSILMGLIISSLWNKPSIINEGLKFSSKKILQLSIIGLGAGLNLKQIIDVGISSMSIMIFTLLAAFFSAFLFGHLLKIPLKLTSLIGMGTAICGGSAIAALSPIIDAKDEDITYSISTIFIFNIFAVLLFPFIGHILNMSDLTFGTFAGTAINDTSSVVAASYSYSSIAGDYATIVKLTRTTMIVPISIIFALVMYFLNKKDKNIEKINYNFVKVFPWFIMWFLLISLINTRGLINSNLSITIVSISKFFILVALAAIGLNSDMNILKKTGFKPMILGLITWFSVSIVSLIVLSLTNKI
jgi:uncharacterized integral membrane protein (TIGR00698 family)